MCQENILFAVTCLGPCLESSNSSQSPSSSACWATLTSGFLPLPDPFPVSLRSLTEDWVDGRTLRATHVPGGQRDLLSRRVESPIAMALLLLGDGAWPRAKLLLVKQVFVQE